MSIVTCYDEFDYTDTSKWDLVNGYAKIRDVAFMEKYQWVILEKVERGQHILINMEFFRFWRSYPMFLIQ